MTAGLQEDAKFGASFYDRGANPPWHNMGILGGGKLEWNAADTLRQFGEYKILKKELKFVHERKTHESGYFALLREPTANDPEYRVLGTPVSRDYEVIQPLDIAEMWDKAMIDASGSPLLIETLGLLGKGHRMFITTELPYAYDVKGDEIKTYLLLDSPFHNGVSYGGYTTPVRTVCQNTLQIGINAAIQQFTITHTKGAAERVMNWIGTMYARSLEHAKIMEEALNVLAEKPLTVPQIRWIVSETYPLPKPLDEEAPSARLPLEQRRHNWQTYYNRIEKLQGDVLNVIEGGGVGMDSPAMREMTAYRVVNGVSEVENYLRKGQLDGRVQGMINGNGAARLKNSYILALNADRYQTASLASLKLMAVEAEDGYEG